MQTVILVLVIILIGILCVALFMTSRDVRNLKSTFLKCQSDLLALQDMLGDVGMSASGGPPPVAHFPSGLMGLPHGIQENMMQSPPSELQKFKEESDDSDDSDDS